MTEAEKIAYLIAEEIKPLLNARWIKLKVAAAYSAIGKARLKELAEQGKIIGFADPDSNRGDWIFDRNSLDEYRMNQARLLEGKVLELLKGL